MVYLQIKKHVINVLHLFDFPYLEDFVLGIYVLIDGLRVSSAPLVTWHNICWFFYED